MTDTAGKTVTGVVPTDDTLIEMVGASVHTGLRKGTDAESAHGIWMAISDSEDGAWTEALAYALYCLRDMGYELVKVEK